MSRKKKFIAAAIVLSLQMNSIFPAWAAEVSSSNAAVHSNNGGTVIVDIAKPNENGLSHNIYNDFSVGKNGLILNNSATSANTVLAGQIVGNSRLNGTPAAIILNEVKGSNISNLNGMIEIAGKRADVIIANPNGITGSGFGFINANRAVLTTGTPNIINGRVDSFDVTGGKVAINGRGKEAISQMPSKLDILAYAAQMNAELYAEDNVNVITGKNKIDFAKYGTDAINKNRQVQGVTLDAAAVGGMYSGAITLIGNDKGLGVNTGSNYNINQEISITDNGQLNFLQAKNNSDKATDELKVPDLPDIAETVKPAETQKQPKTDDTSLKLTADVSANGKYKPIIDHAANGVDLVLISEADGNGVSRNLYTDFNIKSTGLILNNATKYAKTQLGGYVDKNMFLAGRGASVILNEVTSANPSVLNGYLEVAGNKASVVIANANGISVNGLGFINADNVTLAAGRTDYINGSMKFSGNKGNIAINGDGLNGRSTNHLSIIANDTNINKSELWGSEISISNDGKLTNTGKIGAKKSLTIKADELENKENGYIEAGQNLTADVNKSIVQNQASLKADGSLKLTADKISNEENSLISSGQDSTIKTDAEISNDKSVILSGKNMTVSASDISNKNTALINYSSGDFTAKGNFINDNATISSQAADGNTDIKADNFINKNKGAVVASGRLNLTAEHDVNNDTANIYIGKDISIKADKLKNTNEASVHSGQNSSIVAKVVSNDKSSIDVQGNLTTDAKDFINQNNGYIGAGGDARFNLDTLANKNKGSLFITKDLTINSSGDFTNEDGLIVSGGSGNISAQNIYNQNANGQKQGSIINAAEDLSLTAKDTILNQSSDIESQKDIAIKAKDLINTKDVFETGWDVTYQNISYKIPHLSGPNYYDAVREFLRTIHTGVIRKETDDADIIAGGSINIDLENKLTNHYSKIMAGRDLSIYAKEVENIGYQGTIHHDDAGQDTHFWKYKKHKKLHIGCHMVYGTTVIPYEDHNVYDEQPEEYGTDSERLGVLSANSSVKIIAQNVVNKTLEADGKEYEKREKKVPTDVLDRLTGHSAADRNAHIDDKMLDISQLQINSRIYQLTDDPSAKYMIETDSRYADLHSFLSSDYLLERVKADPEKVAKRLGDGYFEQQYVMQQIHELTGKQYLDGCGSDLEQYKQLMADGAAAAEELNLKIGVALTEEQAAALTSDIVWLVKEHVNGEDVLVPEVYLSHVRDEDLQADGALIIGGDVEIYAKDDLQNLGTIKADNTIDLKGSSIENLAGYISGTNIDVSAVKNIINAGGTIEAKNNVNLSAENIVNKTTANSSDYKELHQKTIDNTAYISAGGNLNINAQNKAVNSGAVLSTGGDLNINAKDVDIKAVSQEKHVAVTNNKSSAEIHSIENQQSVLSGNNINISAQSDVNIQGGVLNSSENTSVTAKGDVNISPVKDYYSEESEVGEKGGSYYNHNKQIDETTVGTDISGGKDIAVNAQKDVNIKGSSISSEKGKAALNGENINITAESEYHERLHEQHESSSGLLSSKSKDVYDYNSQNSVVSSSVSANSVDISSKKNTNIKGSSVVADNNVDIKAGGSINVESAAQNNESLYIEQVKKSGILSGGIGFTIGREKQRDEYAQQSIEEIASTVGSINGSVNLNAGKDTNIKGSDIIAGKDADIQGGSVNIENTDSIYKAQEKHEYEKSGLTVSIGGGAIDQLTEGITHIQRADEVKDKRLAALHDYKAYENIKNAAANPTAGIGINVSLGSQKSKSHSNSTTKIANASSVQANGDISITAKDKDINIKGSNVSGDNVELNARENINITASTDENKTSQSSKSSGYGIGANITGSTATANASVNKSKSDIKQNSTTYNESTVIADKDLNFTSGKDTNIKGGTLRGDKVTGSVGGNLNIETKQDSNDYSENSSSAGINTAFHPDSSITGSINKGSVDSSYKSASQQSGIYAGREGFDIDVENNTDLKGAVIDSKAEADKNKLSTGTLSYSDLHNEAEYEASSKGVNINTGKGAKAKDAGITPDIGMPAGDKAESDTKSAVAAGTIEIKDKEHQKQDINSLSRDTSNSLNKLGEIFDRETVEERQELAKMCGETAYKAVGDIAAKNNWDEGSPQKIALHALVGGIMSELGNGDFISGASGATVNEMVQKKLADTFKDDPAMHQWASAFIGGIVSEITEGDMISGASSASKGTQDNYLFHGDQQYLLRDIEKYERGEISQEDFVKKMLYYLAKDNYYALSGVEYDNISDNLKSGGEFIKYQLVRNSLMDIFIDEGIPINNGLSYALQRYAEKKGIDFSDHYGEIIEIQRKLFSAHMEDSKLDNFEEYTDYSNVFDPNSYNGFNSRGDYEYYYNKIEPIPDPVTNKWYIKTSDGSYPVESLGSVGDYYANLGYPVVESVNGLHFTKTPNGSYYYTTANVTINNPFEPSIDNIINKNAGIISSLDENISGGILIDAYESITGSQIGDVNSEAYWQGKVQGDIASGIIGSGLINTGITSSVGGIVISGAGDAAGASISGTGATLAGYGIGITVKSSDNLNDDYIRLEARKNNNKLDVSNDGSIPRYVKENDVPKDKETILQNGEYKKTRYRIMGATVYQKDNKYYYRDTFHKGRSAHLEVFNSKGRHLGEADPLTGKLIPNTADKNKRINLK